MNLVIASLKCRTQLNAAHAQLLQELTLSAIGEIQRFQAIQSLEFQEMWPKNLFRNHVNDPSQKGLTEGIFNNTHVVKTI